MQFFATNEIAEWCQQHEIALSDDWDMDHDWHPVPIPAYHTHIVFGWEGRSGREPGLAAAITDALGPWEECLLWITVWGVWPSNENWPRFYQLRGIRGEPRSVDAAPGHLFAADERDVLTKFLTVVMENGWEAFVLAAPTGAIVNGSAIVSHDGWFDLYSPLAIASE